jgi:hypothetical protein
MRPNVVASSSFDLDEVTDVGVRLELLGFVEVNSVVGPRPRRRPVGAVGADSAGFWVDVDPHVLVAGRDAA